MYYRKLTLKSSRGTPSGAPPPTGNTHGGPRGTAGPSLLAGTGSGPRGLGACCTGPAPPGQRLPTTWREGRREGGKGGDEGGREAGRERLGCPRLLSLNCRTQSLQSLLANPPALTGLGLLPATSQPTQAQECAYHLRILQKGTGIRDIPSQEHVMAMLSQLCPVPAFCAESQAPTAGLQGH